MHQCNIPKEVVRAIASIALIGLVGIICITIWTVKDVPESLSNITVGAVGALSAILATTRREEASTPMPIDTRSGKSTTTTVQVAEVEEPTQ